MSQKTYFHFEQSLSAVMPACTDIPVLQALWHSFCSHMGTLEITEGEALRITMGNASFLPIAEDEEYTVCVHEDGIGLQGRDHVSLMHAFSALLLQIETIDTSRFRIKTQEIRGKFNISRRMIHLCVFPETPLSMLKRLVRLCGILSYTHVVLEFWGMVRYDCLNSLAWKNAFSKEEIRAVIREARALGVEPIPMINHLGHASACRIDSGKHVVLDQDPSQQTLFTPDGWCWNITSEKAKTLLRTMRQELYDLFGNGSYFHIGCDEAHIYSSEYYPLSDLSDYLHDLTSEIILEGRRPILWGDMIIAYDTNADSPEKRQAAERQNERMYPLLSALHPQSVIADWHYDIKNAPVPSTLRFLKAGFDVLGCPWDNAPNIDAHLQTSLLHNTYGLMMTTWHTLHERMSFMLTFARKCGLPKCDWSDYSGHRNLEIATLLRRVNVEGDPLPYEECGFPQKQIASFVSW